MTESKPYVTIKEIYVPSWGRWYDVTIHNSKFEDRVEQEKFLWLAKLRAKQMLWKEGRESNRRWVVE